MYTNLKIQTKQRLRWGVVSALLILSLFLPTAGPVARAQGCQGDDCTTDVSDVARFTTYAMVSSSGEPADGSRPVEIEWTTGYETFNAGFNVVVETVDGFATVNDELIPSEVIDSLERQFYSYTATLAGDEFYLEHVTIEGESHRSGPFTVGESVGEVIEPEEVNWSSIRAASEEMARERSVVRAAEINTALDIVRGPVPSPDEPLVEQSAGILGGRNIYLPMIGGSGDGPQAAGMDEINAVAGVTVNLLVQEQGIYRVTHSDIAATGIDLDGVPSAYLALTNKGVPVRIRMVAAQTWGPGAYFEFVGEGIDTLYTDENVYVLQVDRSKAFRTYRNLREPDMTESAPTYYRETIRFEDNTIWTPAGVEDPWTWGYGNATPSASKTTTYQVTGINNASLEGPAPEITTEVWGTTTGGHHVLISLNTQQVQDIEFTGAVSDTSSVEFDAGLLENGTNDITWALPGDSGASSDTVGFEAVTIQYSRAFVAQNDALYFKGNALLFTVDGLSSDQVSVFSFHRNRWWKMDDVETASSANGYTATFTGWGENAKYFVSVDGSFMTPEIRAGQLPVNITNGSYDFVIIAHPDFLADRQDMDDIYDLVGAREAEDYTVFVVNVLDIYAQFGHSIFGAQAIKDYIKHAIEQMDATHFLLVGDDVMDYRRYVHTSSVSFIPSLYALGYSGQNFMPVDPLYADSTGDSVMDAAIGRFPVKTPAELANIVEKTLDYSSQDRTALFTADFHDGPNYTSFSQDFAAGLPATWQISDAYLEGSSVSVESQNITDAINAGLGLINYLGHSNPDRWTFSGLYSVSNVNSLSNAGKPTFALQYGCWSSMYVHPAFNSMSSAWLTADNKGAAATLGAVGLTSVSSDVAMGSEFSSRVATPDMTIGEALVAAKQAMPQNKSFHDVVLGWVLFGDPTLTLEP